MSIVSSYINIISRVNGCIGVAMVVLKEAQVTEGTVSVQFV